MLRLSFPTHFDRTPFVAHASKPGMAKDSDDLCWFRSSPHFSKDFSRRQTVTHLRLGEPIGININVFTVICIQFFECLVLPCIREDVNRVSTRSLEQNFIADSARVCADSRCYCFGENCWQLIRHSPRSFAAHLCKPFPQLFELPQSTRISAKCSET